MINGWRAMATAPKDRIVIGNVDGNCRLIRYGKTSHIPIYGFCLADQGPEDFDLCEPTAWHEFPPIAQPIDERKKP